MTCGPGREAKRTLYTLWKIRPAIGANSPMIGYVSERYEISMTKPEMPAHSFLLKCFYQESKIWSQPKRPPVDE